MLKFSPANTKLRRLKTVPELGKYLPKGKKIYSLDKLSGWTCPFAVDCLSKVHIVNGKKRIKDGPKTQFRCFSASQEALLPNVYNLRKHNTDLLKNKTLGGMYDLIQASLPKNAGIVRIDVGGDISNQNEFDAWLWIAKDNPSILFYAYTKSLPYWVKRLGMIPENFVLTASYGGRCDYMIAEFNLRSAKVVFSEQEAESMGLEIDHDDSHAARQGGDFALLIHGTQPAGSDASKAIQQLKSDGVEFSYS